MTPSPLAAAHAGEFPRRLHRGWGTYAQKFNGNRFEANVTIRWGTMRAGELGFVWPAAAGARTATVTHGKTSLATTLRRTGDRIAITLAAPVRAQPGESLTVTVA